jgi:hypothetical protein
MPPLIRLKPGTRCTPSINACNIYPPPFETGGPAGSRRRKEVEFVDFGCHWQLAASASGR